MKKAGQSLGRGSRAITSEEEKLWQQATRTLVRVKTKARVAASLPAEEPRQSPVASSLPAAKPRQSRSERPGAAREVARIAVAAPPETLDRRQMRRIAAGRTDIDARIDLHGLRQAEAHARLRSFLASAYAAGL